jgi:hypothetical protein
MSDIPTNPLQELLTSPEEEKKDEEEFVDTTICETCGGDVEEGVEICPLCGGLTELQTIASLGKRLPIGVELDGKLEKGFDIKPLGWGLEREIGREWAKRRKTLDIGKYISTILAHTVLKIGPHDVTALSMNRRFQVFAEMFAGDVFYMYAYLRLISTGKEMSLRGLTCYECNHSFSFVADVSTLGVVCFETIQEMEREIKLQDGFEMGGGHRDTFILRPPKWRMMSDPLAQGSLANDAELFGAMLMHSVVEVKGLNRGAAITERELDKMTKPDLEICKEGMELLIGGPRWFVDSACPKCKEEFFYEIDWSYQNFFARSSTSRRRKKRSKKRQR